MRHGSTGFAFALIGLLGAPAVMAQYSGSAPGERTLRCESSDGRERHCPADTRGGVRMARQLSRSACEQGRSWGVDRAGVWVGQGCRADFLLGGGGSAYDDGGGRSAGRSSGRIVRCESDSGRSNFCAMDTRHGVELVKQLSRSACIRERSWGWTDQGVWVSGGCRAEFRLRGGGYTDGPPVTALQSLRCESVDGRQRHCPFDTRGGVRLVRQLSRTACVEGHSWGHDRRGVWVQGGCRADFEVGGRGEWRGR